LLIALGVSKVVDYFESTKLLREQGTGIRDQGTGIRDQVSGISK
jgi:hypothetical protein